MVGLTATAHANGPKENSEDTCSAASSSAGVVLALAKAGDCDVDAKKKSRSKYVSMPDSLSSIWNSPLVSTKRGRCASTSEIFTKDLLPFEW